MVNIEQIGSTLKVSHYNSEGKLEIENIRLPQNEMYNWVYASQNEKCDMLHRSFDNKPVKKIRASRLNKYRMMEILYSLPNDIKDRIFSGYQPERWFMDIETEVIDGFPNAEAPKEKVLANSFCNQKNQVYITYIEKKLTKIQKENITNKINKHFEPLGRTFDVKFKYYESEPMLLSDLFYNIIPNMQCVCGWNFYKFDWQFLVNRAKQFDVDYTRCSPTQDVHTMMLADKFVKGKKSRIELPMHKLIIDYMLLWEKFDTSMKLKNSSQLDYVAEKLIGLKKLKYNGSLMDMYHNDIERYLAYNAIDTILNSLIDEMLQLLQVPLVIVQDARVSIYDTMYASKVLTPMFSEEFYKDKMVFVEKEESDDFELKGKKYKGAYVHEPQPGFFKYVIVQDFESEFPSCICANNIGTDTFLGISHDDGETFVDNYGKIIKFDRNKHIYSAKGAVYNKNKESVMRRVTGKLFGGRVEAKKISQAIDKEIAILESIIKDNKQIK